MVFNLTSSYPQWIKIYITDSVYCYRLGCILVLTLGFPVTILNVLRRFCFAVLIFWLKSLWEVCKVRLILFKLSYYVHEFLGWVWYGFNLYFTLKLRNSRLRWYWRDLHYRHRTQDVNLARSCFANGENESFSMAYLF